MSEAIRHVVGNVMLDAVVQKKSLIFTQVIPDFCTQLSKYMIITTNLKRPKDVLMFIYIHTYLFIHIYLYTYEYAYMLSTIKRAEMIVFYFV